ncbi:uncharacterized protein LOC117822164 isoform X4 [Xyrichtys novacula]|uniref:Uncharacterized protein LOC117822164 isoform X4 n=1 Tax=Xyrichtys novacula TaxID=13765 RepID=A0AAV1HI18_XYRNO|nr:uncharacterized protein LOC117822164 isoform X4 [Xyrichtys novacula]
MKRGGVLRGRIIILTDESSSSFHSKDGRERRSTITASNMRVQPTLICSFFFLMLKDGVTALFEEDIGVRYGTEGEDITVRCNFKISGKRRIFCRNKCGDGDILIETTNNSRHQGRYSIEYYERGLIGPAQINVSITNLRKSDSGRYSCWLDRRLSLDSKETFQLNVRNASTTTTTTTTKTTTTTTKTTTIQSVNSSTENTTTPLGQKSSSNPLLYLGLLLLLLIIILSLILLIYYKKRAPKPKNEATGRPVETDYADVSETNRDYEEIREEDRPVFTVYACAKFSKPNGVEITDDYSLLSAAESQNKTGDDSNKLLYTTVDFSNSPAASLTSAPSREPKNVIYSVPRVPHATSEDADPPLYSTVTPH